LSLGLSNLQWAPLVCLWVGVFKGRHMWIARATPAMV
jgi:hypothetical protein